MDLTPDSTPEQVQAALVVALRSGAYIQGRSALCTASPDGTDRWCCLGVATDLAIKAGLPVVRDGGPRLDRFGHYYFLAEDAHGEQEEPVGQLPYLVKRWLGAEGSLARISPDSGMMGEDGPAHTLADANDAGNTFAQIADAIEAGAMRVTS